MIGNDNNSKDSLNDLKNVILFLGNMEGTLLHRSTFWVMYNYTKLLTSSNLPFRFDCLQKNLPSSTNCTSNYKPQSAYGSTKLSFNNSFVY